MSSYIHAWMYTHRMYTHTHTHTNKNQPTHIHTYVHTYIRTYVHTYFQYIGIQTYTNTYTKRVCDRPLDFEKKSSHVPVPFLLSLSFSSLSSLLSSLSLFLSSLSSLLFLPFFSSFSDFSRTLTDVGVVVSRSALGVVGDDVTWGHECSFSRFFLFHSVCILLRSTSLTVPVVDSEFGSFREYRYTEGWQRDRNL